MSLYLVNSQRFGGVFASLYQSFQDLTTVQKSHFVEWFSGKVLDAIWSTSGTAGGTALIQDVIDGGLIIKANASVSAFWTMHFNAIRHYEPTGAVIIQVYKFGIATSLSTAIGFSEDDFASGTVSHAYMRAVTGTDNKFAVRSADGTTNSRTASTIVLDTNRHTQKFELGPSDIKFSLDGILEITKTTNRPISKQQPLYAVQNSEGSGAAHDIQTTLCEAFNV